VKRAFALGLTDARIHAGVPREECAARASLSLDEMIELEEGHPNPPLSTICALAAALDIEASYLIAFCDRRSAQLRRRGPRGAVKRIKRIKRVFHFEWHETGPREKQAELECGHIAATLRSEDTVICHHCQQTA
jgi:transcriptional regulator with XRE-family HTH domain